MPPVTPSPAPTISDEAKYNPHTIPAIGVSVCGYVLTMITYCYLDDRKIARTLRLMKITTAYDLLLVGFYATQAYMFFTFLSEQGAMTGFDVVNGDHIKKWLRIHAYSRLLHVIDTLYPLYRSNKGQISWALLWHNLWILPLWGFILDNKVLLNQGYVTFIAMVMCVMYSAIYAYLAISVWQKCVTPGAHLTTALEVTVYCVLFLHSCIAFYFGTQESSVVQMQSTGAWCVYNLGMMIFVMKLMWKKRPLDCWPTLQMSTTKATVGGDHGIPQS